MSCKVAAAGIDGRGGDSLSDTPKIERRYGDCDVTITFKENARDIKDNVLWLIMESYRERLTQKLPEGENTKADPQVKVG